MKTKKKKKTKKKVGLSKRENKKEIEGYYIPGDGTIQTLYKPKW